MRKIKVFDKNHNPIGETYPKRAEGLVKKGRAEYSPDKNSITLFLNNTEEQTTMKVNNTENITPAEILERIDNITADTEHLKTAFAELSEMYELPDGYNADTEDAVKTIAVEREKTNQKLIDLLSRLYDDVRPPKPVEPAKSELSPVERFQLAKETYEKLYPNGLSHEAEESLHRMAEKMFEMQ